MSSQLNPGGGCVLSILLLVTNCYIRVTADAAAVETGVCLLYPLFEQPSLSGRQLHVSRVGGDRFLRAALLAVDHVNSRNCSVLGPRCEGLLDTSDGGPGVRLRPYFSDLHGFSPATAPAATQRCFATDAQILVGATTSEQSNLVAAFVGGLGWTRPITCQPTKNC
jgi:hypothetical protein